MVGGLGQSATSDLAASASQPGRVLTVCTGNVCRSPLLERVLQRALDRRWGAQAFLVRSAGTHGLEGAPMDERSAAVLRGLGGTPDGFVARRLRPGMAAEADLVLTATLDQRARVVRAHPAAIRYAFTFREFAALADTLTDDELPGPGPAKERLAVLAGLLATRRGPVAVPEPDITDPYRRADEVYDLMEEQVRAALPSALRALT